MSEWEIGIGNGDSRIKLPTTSRTKFFAVFLLMLPVGKGRKAQGLATGKVASTTVLPEPSRPLYRGGWREDPGAIERWAAGNMESSVRTGKATLGSRSSLRRAWLSFPEAILTRRGELLSLDVRSVPEPFQTTLAKTGLRTDWPLVMSSPQGRATYSESFDFVRPTVFNEP
jgi:hypothetical protein